MEDDIELVGHAKANRRLFAGGDTRPSLRFRQVATRSGVPRWTAFLHCRAPLRLELRRRTETVVRAISLEQRVCVRLVEVEAFGLPIRPERSAGVGSLFPIETQPLEVAQDGSLGLPGRPLDIAVFDAEDERAAVAARQQPIKDGGAHIPNVQLPSRARGKSNSHTE